MKHKDRKSGYLMIFLAGVFWGMIGLFSTEINRCGVNSAGTALIRMTFCALFLIPVLLVTGGPARFKIDRRGLLTAACLGVFAQAFFNISYAAAIEQTGMAAAAVLLYTAPVFVAVMSRIFFHEKISSRKRIALLINIFGCVLTVTGGTFSLSGLSLSGIFFGIAAGFLYALITIISTAGLKDYDPLTITFYSFTFGAAAIAVLTHPFANIAAAFSPRLLLLSIGFGIIPTFCAYFFFMNGLTHDLETSKVPVIASVETIVAALIGVLAFHEDAGPIRVLGIAVVVFSIALMNLNLTRPADAPAAHNSQ